MKEFGRQKTASENLSLFVLSKVVRVASCSGHAMRKTPVRQKGFSNPSKFLAMQGTSVEKHMYPDCLLCRTRRVNHTTHKHQEQVIGNIKQFHVKAGSLRQI